jgi:hypothetical protein
MNARLVETLPDGAQVTRALPNLDPGRSVTEMFTYKVPVAIANGSALTGRAAASGQGPTGGAETETNNNTATARATAHSAPCKVTAAGQIGPTRSFLVAAAPLGALTVGSTTYTDLTPRPIVALVSLQTTGVACLGKHARIFGRGLANGFTQVTFQVDVEDRGAGPGTDTFAIAWPG